MAGMVVRPGKPLNVELLGPAAAQVSNLDACVRSIMPALTAIAEHDNYIMV